MLFGFWGGPLTVHPRRAQLFRLAHTSRASRRARQPRRTARHRLVRSRRHGDRQARRTLRSGHRDGSHFDRPTRPPTNWSSAVLLFRELPREHRVSVQVRPNTSPGPAPFSRATSASPSLRPDPTPRPGHSPTANAVVELKRCVGLESETG